MRRGEDLYGVDCCGCSACALSCPTHAIHMEFKDGSYRPIVEPDACINCGKCIRSCQIISPDFYSTASPVNEAPSYVAVAKDGAILKRSSSGGVGKLLSDRALRTDGVCCGAVYSETDEQCEHRVCTSNLELRKTQGSKYLQSANEDAFRKIVEMGHGTIIGTPCQIAGIDRVLKQNGIRDRYLLVDIFCHGVPNQLLWNNHLTWMKRNKGVPSGSEVRFRENKKFRLSVGGYRAWYNEDAFYTFFLRGWLYNKSCYSCHLRRQSFADIRIGDCLIKEFERLPYSPSCICVLTQNGATAINEVWDELEIYEIPFEIIDSVQEKANRSMPSNYDEIVRALKAGRCPGDLISRTIFLGKVKSLVKNRVFGKIPIYRKSVELRELVGRLTEGQ